MAIVRVFEYSQLSVEAVGKRAPDDVVVVVLRAGLPAPRQDVLVHELLTIEEAEEDVQWR